MIDAKENVKETKKDMKEAVITAIDTAKIIAIANWRSFKNKSDSDIASMDNELTKFEAKIAKENNAIQATLKTDLYKAKQQLQIQKEKLQQKNIEFENDINHFDIILISKNQSFQREFKHDIKELDRAFKDLFRENIK